MENVYQVVSNEKGTRYFNYSGLTLNFKVVGYNRNTHNREELQGQPKLAGLNGPMYNGTKDGKVVIRYETPAHYATYD
jgi:hypothetical protein